MCKCLLLAMVVSPLSVTVPLPAEKLPPPLSVMCKFLFVATVTCPFKFMVPMPAVNFFAPDIVVSPLIVFAPAGVVKVPALPDMSKSPANIIRLWSMVSVGKFMEGKYNVWLLDSESQYPVAKV